MNEEIKKIIQLLPLAMESEMMRIRVGERFLLIRRNILKRNQQRMGQIIGISVDRLSDFETGKKTTDPSIVYRLLVYLMSKRVDIRLLFLDDFSLEQVKESIERNNKYHFNFEII